MTQQTDIESGVARRIRFQRGRDARQNQPTAERGARGRLRAKADHDERHARMAHLQCKTAVCFQIEHRRRAPEFDDHGAERGAACAFLGRAEDRRRIAGAQQDQPPGIEAEGGQARAVESSRFGIGMTFLHPEKRASARCSERDAKAESRDHARIRDGFPRVEFMQSTARKPAAKTRVDRLQPEREKLRSAGSALLFQGRKGPPQRRYG